MQLWVACFDGPGESMAKSLFGIWPPKAIPGLPLGFQADCPQKHFWASCWLSRISALRSIIGLSMGFPAFLASQENSRLTTGFPGWLPPEALLGFLWVSQHFWPPKAIPGLPLGFQGNCTQKHHWAFCWLLRLSAVETRPGFLAWSRLTRLSGYAVLHYPRFPKELNEIVSKIA